jgi:hypothetical protein
MQALWALQGAGLHPYAPPPLNAALLRNSLAICQDVTDLRYLKAFRFTMYNVILSRARNFLETSENIKILTHPYINLDWFSCKMKQKKYIFLENKFKMDNSKMSFLKSPILKTFSRKFHRLVFGLVELIDAKGIDVAQHIWPWGYPT